MRRTKSDGLLGGIIIIGVVTVASYNYLQDKPQLYIPLALIIAAIVFSTIRSSRAARAKAEAARAAAEQAEREYLDWGVERALSIATHQKFVSPHRLQRQIDVTEKEALRILREASDRGVVKQAVNGRYYTPDKFADTED